MRNFLILTVAVMALSLGLNAQEKAYAHKIVNKLCAKKMKGRGYVGKGDYKAATFLASEMKRIGLKPLYNNYLQEYSFPINTFPGTISLKVDGKKLAPASDYMVSLNSPKTNGAFELRFLLNDSLQNSQDLQKLKNQDLRNCVVVSDKYHKEFSDTNVLGAAGYIFLKDSSARLVWRVSNGHKVNPYFVLEVKNNRICKQNKAISVSIDQEFIPQYRTNNVAGMVEGTEPDSFIVYTAHYDHLGMMGNKTYFPGANDNASGVAAILDLARYFMNHKPKYSLVFIALSGEEAGLLGAKYCANNPPMPLSNVRFLINLDMVGTGSEGITAVQADVFPKAYNLLVKLNADNELIRTVKSRGESCNSDHCPFYQKGVPSFFIYSMGPEWNHYHDPGDVSKGLPFTELEDIERLLISFVNTY